MILQSNVFVEIGIKHHKPNLPIKIEICILIISSFYMKILGMAKKIIEIYIYIFFYSFALISEKNMQSMYKIVKY